MRILGAFIDNNYLLTVQFTWVAAATVSWLLVSVVWDFILNLSKYLVEQSVVMWPWRILVDLQLVGLSDNKSGQISLVQFWLQSCSVPPGRLQGAAARPSCCCSSGVLFGVQQLLLCDSPWQRSMWCDSCCNADARRKFRPCPPLPGRCDWELQLKNFQPEPRRRLWKGWSSGSCLVRLFQACEVTDSHIWNRQSLLLETLEMEKSLLFLV